jgi:hypothetical protein
MPSHWVPDGHVRDRDPLMHALHRPRGGSALPTGRDRDGRASGRQSLLVYRDGRR